MKTNVGVGLTFEIIKDYNYTVSETLNRKPQLNQLNFQDPYLRVQLSILRQFLLKQCVI